MVFRCVLRVRIIYVLASYFASLYIFFIPILFFRCALSRLPASPSRLLFVRTLSQIHRRVHICVPVHFTLWIFRSVWVCVIHCELSTHFEWAYILASCVYYRTLNAYNNDTYWQFVIFCVNIWFAFRGRTNQWMNYFHPKMANEKWCIQDSFFFEQKKNRSQISIWRRTREIIPFKCKRRFEHISLDFRPKSAYVWNKCKKSRRINLKQEKKMTYLTMCVCIVSFDYRSC